MVCKSAKGRKTYISVSKQVKGDIPFFNTAFWGGPDAAVDISGGRLIINQADFMTHGKGLFAHEGELTLVNSFFRKEGEILNVSPKAHVTAIANTVNGKLLNDR